MSALVAGSVSYTIYRQKKLEDGRKIVQAKLSFGDGALTYPTGGVPLVIGNLGMRAILESFSVDDNGISSYGFSYDKVNQKLVMFAVGAHAHDVLLKNAAVADGATTRVNAGANLLGANTGSDVTVVGAGANGGVKLSTSANTAGIELASTIAPAAQSIKITVIGY